MAPPFLYTSTLPPGMLRRNPSGRRGKPGAFKLRFCYRATREHAAREIEIGLHTRNHNEAYVRAVLILRAYITSGFIAGLYAGQLDLSLRRSEISPSQKACNQAKDKLKQGVFNF